MKSIAALIMVNVCVLGLAACNLIPNFKPEETSDSEFSALSESSIGVEETDNIDLKITVVPTEPGTEVSDEPTETTEEELPDQIKAAVAFVDAIMDGKYDDAVEMLHIKDTTFLHGEDLKWYLSRTDYADLVENRKELTEWSETGSVTEKVVSLAYGKTTVHLNVFMDENNDYVVRYTDWYVSDWKFRVPGGAMVSIGDVEVSEDYYIEKYNDYFDVYKIPAIAQRTVEISVESHFSSRIAKVLPDSSGNLQYIKLTCPEEMREELEEKTLEMLNAMYEAYESGKTSSDYAEFLDDSLADPDLAEYLYDCVSRSYYCIFGLFAPTKISIQSMKKYDGWDINEMFIISSDDTIIVTANFNKLYYAPYDGYKDKIITGQFTVSYKNDEMKLVKGSEYMTNLLSEERPDDVR